MKYSKCRDFLFLGRGLLFPIALEGALKLKEISYIHAEGYAAGEIKHGPIALVCPEVPSVFLVPDDGLREKVISNIREVKARGGLAIAVGVEGSIGRVVGIDGMDVLIMSTLRGRAEWREIGRGLNF